MGAREYPPSRTPGIAIRAVSAGGVFYARWLPKPNPGREGVAVCRPYAMKVTSWLTAATGLPSTEYDWAGVPSRQLALLALYKDCTHCVRRRWNRHITSAAVVPRAWTTAEFQSLRRRPRTKRLHGESADYCPDVERFRAQSTASSNQCGERTSLRHPHGPGVPQIRSPDHGLRRTAPRVTLACCRPSRHLRPCCPRPTSPAAGATAPRSAGLGRRRLRRSLTITRVWVASPPGS